MPNNAPALLQRKRTKEREGEREGTGGNCRMESSKQQCVGTTGSISVKQAFQKALMAEGRMKQQSKQVHVWCFAL